MKQQFHDMGENRRKTFPLLLFIAACRKASNPTPTPLGAVIFCAVAIGFVYVPVTKKCSPIIK